MLVTYNKTTKQILRASIGLENGLHPEIISRDIYDLDITGEIKTLIFQDDYDVVLFRSNYSIDDSVSPPIIKKIKKQILISCPGIEPFPDSIYRVPKNSIVQLKIHIDSQLMGQELELKCNRGSFAKRYNKVDTQDIFTYYHGIDETVDIKIKGVIAGFISNTVTLSLY